MKRTVLVVDDDPVSLNLVRVMIEQAGDLFTGARCLDEARRLTERKPPDIAIVDLMLGSENGLDLVRLWRVERRFPVFDRKRTRRTDRSHHRTRGGRRRLSGQAA
ncbi:MAG: response regulator [Betaproteobacteria bacterium]|nr:response regulator [Betaproteobacteria bacterium]